MGEQKIDFTRQLLILGNLALVVWVFLAFFGVLFYTLIYSWLYLIFEGVMVYIVQRRIGCSSCYNCKTCTSGFGRLAGAFFGKGSVKKASVGNRIQLGLVGFIYFLLLPFPAALTVLSMLQVFTVPKLIVLICLLALGAYSFATWHTRSTVKS